MGLPRRSAAYSIGIALAGPPSHKNATMTFKVSLLSLKALSAIGTLISSFATKVSLPTENLKCCLLTFLVN